MGSGTHVRRYWLIYIVLVVLLLSLFIENFILSEDFRILQFRSIDDLAFQLVLRDIHVAMSQGNFLSLLQRNDYGYGWIFWFPLGIITYPLYLINTYFSVAWPLISFPRQLSLVFGLGSLWFLHKILDRMAIPRWACASSVLIFALFPTFGSFSLRFGTVNAVMFFAVLAVYFAQKDEPSTRTGRLKVIVCVAAAGGIKLTGLLIAPLAFCLILSRLKWAGWTGLIKIGIQSVVTFLIFLIFFLNPALFVAPFDFSIWTKYVSIIKHFVGVTRDTTEVVGFFDLLLTIVFGKGIAIFSYILLFIGIGILYAKDKLIRRDLAAILFSYFFVAIYLAWSVNNAASAVIYMTVVSFLLVVGVGGWAKCRYGKIAVFIIFLILAINVFIGAGVLKQFGYGNQPVNHFSFFTAEGGRAKKLEIVSNIDQCLDIKDKIHWTGHVFVDYTLPNGLNQFTLPKACVSVAWGNLSPNGKYCGTPVDYLVLDPLAIGALPEAEFQNKVGLADAKTGDAMQVDRASREQLRTSGRFDGHQFKEICADEDVRVYRAVN